MKKIFLTLLIMIVALNVIACGGKNASPESSSPIVEDVSDTTENTSEENTSSETDEALTLYNVSFKVNGTELSLPCNYSDFVSLFPTMKSVRKQGYDIEYKHTGFLNAGNTESYQLREESTSEFYISVSIINPTDEALPLSDCDIYNICFQGPITLSGYTFEFPYGVVINEDGLSYDTDRIVLDEGIRYREFIQDGENVYVAYRLQMQNKDDGKNFFIDLYCNNGVRPEKRFDFDLATIEDNTIFNEAEETPVEFEGYEEEFTIYSKSFDKRKVSMYTPVEINRNTSDMHALDLYINDNSCKLVLGGQNSMGMEDCDDPANILEFYNDQIIDAFEIGLITEFEMAIDNKEKMDFNGNSMYKYTGAINYLTGSKVSYPFVAYTVNVDGISFYWLLADQSENRDQMELLEKQALTMAESFTVK